MGIALTHAIRERSHFNQERWNVLETALERLTVDGCLVELGVHRGGCLAYLALSQPTRAVFGYDTFDRGAVGSEPVDQLDDGILAHPKDEVVRFLGSVCPPNWVVFECDVRTELPTEHPPIALAVIDLNLHSPTLAALRWVRDHASPGSIVLVDDLDFPGVALALSEFVAESGLTFERLGYMAGFQL